ncbi:MAG: hypothetical protein AB7O86_14475 [Porticoccaceae bacterium]
MSRGDAIANGHELYYTGKPCKRGHIAPRKTLFGTCTECQRESSREALAKARAAFEAAKKQRVDA